MPKRVATQKTSPVELKIKLPLVFKKLENVNWRKFLPKSSTQILVVLLVIAAFLLGVLFTKVQYLEKNQLAVNNPTAVPAAPGQQAAPTPGVKVNVNAGHFPILGNKDAKVTMIEFADFRCPFCEQFYSQTEPQIIKDYVDTGKVKFTFRNFAFLGPAIFTKISRQKPILLCIILTLLLRPQCHWE